MTTQFRRRDDQRVGKGASGHDRDAITPDPVDPDERREFEKRLLAGAVVQTVVALMQEAGVNQRELAERLGWTQPRISQILNSENLNLSTAADLAWALGYRFEAVPIATPRAGTPASNDPPPPAWVRRQARALLGR